MTDRVNRRVPARLVACLPLAGLVSLQGCADEKPLPARPSGIVFSGDLKGAARLCTVPKQVTLVAGKAAEVMMTLSNDGGWCGVGLSQSGPQPYAAGLLTERPAHGKIYIHSVGYQTRIDYTPDPGFAGADAFRVELIPNPTTADLAGAVHVAVMVQAASLPTPAPPVPRAGRHSADDGRQRPIRARDSLQSVAPTPTRPAAAPPQAALQNAAAEQPEGKRWPTPPIAALQDLWAHPEKAKAFDRTFGPGSAARAMQGKGTIAQ
jgi:hypothetical protein